MGAFDRYPNKAEDEAPHENKAEGLFNAFCFVVLSKCPLAKSAFAEEAYELSVMDTAIIVSTIQEPRVMHGLFSE